MTLPSPVLGYPHLLFADPTFPCCYNLLLLDNTCHGLPKLAQPVPGGPKMTLAALTRTRLLQPVLGCTTNLPLANSNLFLTAPTCPLLPQPVHDCPNLYLAAPISPCLHQPVLAAPHNLLLLARSYPWLYQPGLRCQNLFWQPKLLFAALTFF